MGEHQLELTHVHNVCAEFTGPRVAQFPAFSWLRSMASRLSKVADDTPLPVARLTKKLALQNPSRSSSEGSTRAPVEVDGSVGLITWRLIHVARTQAPSPER